MSNTSWDLDTGSGGDKQKVEFTKFPEGITRVRVVDEAPFQRWTHFFKKARRSLNCPGKGCPICEIRKMEKANKQPHVHNMTKRFALNVINRETNRIEILEQGKTFIQDLKDIMGDLKEEGNALIDADLKVRRRGTGIEDTTYRIDVDKVYPLTEKDNELIKNRIKLDEYFQPHTPEQILRLLAGEEWDAVMSTNQDVEIKTEKFEEPIGDEEDFELA